jgi:predicted 3-demethylubiquinone-9 3-methyltransferase (glyoxalase superfamily)
MQKIIPHIWFDKESEQAIKLYTSIFPDSKITSQNFYTEAGFEIHGQPAGQLMSTSFELAGFKFMAINAGPVFKANPSISFSVADEADMLWNTLIDGGTALMPYQEYPFSPKYGWVQDQFGVSWQISYDGKTTQTSIMPSIMFAGQNAGKAEEAINYYAGIFKDSHIDMISRYGENPGPDSPQNINYSEFTLENVKFTAMDSAIDHKFQLNEAISLLVNCNDQAEIDYYWDKLSEGGDPNAQQCGWLKDKYGVSWQINSVQIEQLMNSSDIEKVKRVTNAFLKMKKFDIQTLENA